MTIKVRTKWSRAVPGVFAAGLGLVAVAPALAADSLALSESDYLSDLPIVLSVSRLAQPLDATPAAVTVIDREMIRASGARQIWELMRLVPGFQSAGVAGASPVVTYHGLSEQFPRRVQVLVDGSSQYSPFLAGGVNWDLLPLSIDDVERIEVIRGSNSAAYGSNAFKGVINIISRRAAERPGVGMAVANGAQGVRDTRVRWSGSVGPGAVRVTAEEIRDDGLDRFRDARATTRLDLRGDFRLDARDEIQVQFAGVGQTIDVGDPTRPLNNNGDPPRRQRFDNATFQTIWRRTLAADEDLVLRYEHRRETGRDAPVIRIVYSDVIPVTAPVDFGFTARRDVFEVQHTATIGDRLRLVSGGGYRADSVVSRGFFNRLDPVSLNVSRIFGNAEWRPGPLLTVNLGATWERDSLSGSTLSPRAGLNLHVDRHHTVRAALARAYRTPSLLEGRALQVYQTLPVVVPPVLLVPTPIVLHGFASRGAPQPEQLDSAELGYLGELPSLGLRLDARAFLERVKDRIMFEPFPLQPPNCNQPVALIGCGLGDSPVNMQDSVVRGLEYQLEWRPATGSRILLNQSFVGIRSSHHDIPASVNAARLEAIRLQTNESAPTHSTTLMLMQRLPGGLDFSATFHSVGAMRWTNNSYVKAYHRVDWRLGLPFRFGPQSGEVALTVQSDSPGHGERDANQIVTRRAFASLRLDF